MSATGPLQTIVDALAADIQRDVAIDDRRIRWIVHSPHSGEPDAARLQSILATTQLLGGPTRFVLSSAGHVAALVNPPGNVKARYRTAPAGANPPSAHDWAEAAEQRSGSWWPDWAGWLGERSGAERPAPKRLGGRGFKLVGSAPGSYVLAG